MTRLAIAAIFSLVIQSCASDVWEAAGTGLCIASEADCLKSCRHDFEGGYADNFGYDYCAASCTGGGNGCAFTAN